MVFFLSGRREQTTGQKKITKPSKLSTLLNFITYYLESPRKKRGNIFINMLGINIVSRSIAFDILRILRNKKRFCLVKPRVAC